MGIEDIQQAVRAEVGDAFTELTAQWCAQGGSVDDVDGFVAWLHERGRIGRDTFRSLHVGGVVQLTSLATLETYYADDETAESLVGDADDDEDDDDSEDDAPTQHHALPLGDTAAFPIRARKPKASVIEPVSQADLRFHFLGKLAAGAMGEIHIARDRELHRKVAIKRMTDRVRRSRKLSGRFYTEAQVTAQLDHPNIVPVYSLEGDPEGGLAYTMKLIKGKTFTDLVHDVREAYDAGRVPDEEHELPARLEWFLRVCDAIAYAHDRGVIHRDLKPDNIMVGKFGEVFVMDWGIARINSVGDDDGEGLTELADDTSSGVTRTRLGTVIGTPAYMSPEQAEGNNDRIDGRSDGFALGLILYELCCLRQAFVGADPMSLLLKVQRGEMLPFQPWPTAPPLPPELKAIVAKATRVDREARYPSVKALADDVRRYLRGEVTTALPHGPWRRMRTWLSEHTTLMLVTLLVSGAVTAATGITGLTSVLYQRVQADVREAQLANLLGEVSGQSRALDAELYRSQGLLKVLAADAVRALGRAPDSIGPEGDHPFLAEPFAPPDLASSPRYRTRVSQGWPVLKRPENPASDEAIRQLTLLRQPMQRVLLQSIGDDAVGVPEASARELLLETGAPLAWAYVALPDGTLVHYPGHTHFPEVYDVTEREWYQLAENARGPQWGSPLVDFAGLGLMLPCSMALVDDEGTFRGVAGIEMSFQYILDELLEAEALQGVADTFVIDADGYVVVQSSDKRRSRTASGLGKRHLRKKRFPVAEVLERRATRPGGHVVYIDRRGERQLAVWNPLDSVPGWTYVIRGDPRDLLATLRSDP